METPGYCQHVPPNLTPNQTLLKTALVVAALQAASLQVGRFRVAMAGTPECRRRVLQSPLTGSGKHAKVQALLEVLAHALGDAGPLGGGGRGGAPGPGAARKRASVGKRLSAELDDELRLVCDYVDELTVPPSQSSVLTDRATGVPYVAELRCARGTTVLRLSPAQSHRPAARPKTLLIQAVPAAEPGHGEVAFSARCQGDDGPHVPSGGAGEAADFTFLVVQRDAVEAGRQAAEWREKLRAALGGGERGNERWAQSADAAAAGERWRDAVKGRCACWRDDAR